MYSSDYVWSQVVAHLERQLGSVAVSSFLDDAKVIDFTEESLVLYSPSDFRRESIRKTFIPYIEDALRDIFQSKAKLVICDDENIKKHNHDEQPPLVLPPQFTFDRFITGTSNKLASAAAVAVSHAPGQIYNPLFIYGPSGVGKTHLLYSIAAEQKS